MSDADALDLERALEVARAAAREGGATLRTRLGDPGWLSWKGDRDVVCQVALEVQETIVGALQKAFPGSGVLAEEGPEEAEVPVDSPLLWIVDPICGSLNLARGIPFFAVSVALRHEGTIRLGVVYDPCRDELFEAVEGGPAKLDRRPLTVGLFSEGSEAWEAAFLGTDWPHAGERRRLAERTFGVMMDQVLECNAMGSPALGLCYVAAGRLHGYWHLDLSLWDVAAAALILERAGGLLTDIRGDSWLYSDGGYIGSNRVVHGWILNCLRGVRAMEEKT